MNCKLIIRDEVNVKFEGLAVETRRKIVNKLKYDLPYARHMPAFKLGRWDGTVSFFGIGGNGFLAHLDVALPIVENDGYDIEVIDQRNPTKLDFEKITENYWADQGICWPEGHPEAGKPIVLRDYQYDVVNKFLENPQSLQEIATGAGKTITTATLSHLCEPYGRTMVIVPNKSLVVQTEEDYKNEKEKEYLNDLKGFYKYEESGLNEEQEINGVFIPNKLITKNSKRSCPVCNVYSFKSNDDVYMSKFDCCEKCYIQYIEGREDRWKTGWRPNETNNTKT